MDVLSNARSNFRLERLAMDGEAGSPHMDVVASCVANDTEQTTPSLRDTPQEGNLFGIVLRFGAWVKSGERSE